MPRLSTPIHTVQSFQDAESVTSRTGKLANNTYGRFEEINGKRYYIIRFHDTDIVRHGEDKTTDFCHGGFITQSTAARMAMFSRFAVFAYIPRMKNVSPEMRVTIPANTAFTFRGSAFATEYAKLYTGESPENVNIESDDWLRIFN